MADILYGYQKDAIKQMKNGCVLCGGVGSGKSRTSLAYYFMVNGGRIFGSYENMKNPRDLYIITTAKKRDSGEWEEELTPFCLSTDISVNYYHNKVVIDSWNNIGKYVDVVNAFFIFDEQRVVGYGAWTKSFIKICKKNRWVLLSATPGDKWEDYIPVFIANGFYRNKTEFVREHIVYSSFTKFPKVDRYLNVGRLIRLRNAILVKMDYVRKTTHHHIDVWCEYDKMKYKDICRFRWNPWTDKPIKNASEFCYSLRRVVNEDVSREVKILEIMEDTPKVIIFYNFDYELAALRDLFGANEIIWAEWNGHCHEPIPEDDEWAYLVQYNAGSEGWNYIGTDTIIFYSQSYSYKMMVQAAGRIDRLNTPFFDLYYYHFVSRSGIDIAIRKALQGKKKFNETRYAKEMNFDDK